MATSDIHSTWHYHPFLSWRSVFAGLICSFLVYSLLILLGLAFAGNSLIDILREGGNGGQELSVSAALWIIIVTSVALFAGGCFAGRISTFTRKSIGVAQGVVLSALFFGLMALQVTSTLGWMGRGVSNLIGSVGRTSTSVLSSPGIRDSLSNVLINRTLRSDPDTITKGLATRLLAGDYVDARNYVAWEAMMSTSEAQSRIDSLRAQLQDAAKAVATDAARTLELGSLIILLLMVLGTSAAVLGGAMGVSITSKHPETDPISYAPNLSPGKI